MTTQALDRVMSEDGRYYVLWAGTDREQRFRSVTAPLGRWDKDGLLPWAALLAGQGAFDQMPQLVAALGVEDCGRTYRPNCDTHGWDVQCPECRCKRCEPCLVRWMRDRHEAESRRRADEGTRVHEIMDHWATTGVWLSPTDDIEPYVKTLREWVAEIGLTPADFELLEARVINRQYMYAGTLDAAFWIFRDRSALAGDVLDRISGDGPRLDRALILGDYKSREKPGRRLYLDQPLQLAAYRRAEAIVLKDGTELPMFAVDAAAIVQIRPDGTSLELVLADEPEFDTFTALLVADEWALERGKQAIGARTFKYSEPIKKLRAADARKRAKAAKLAAQEAAKDAPEAEGAPESPPPPPDAAPVADEASPAARGARAAAAARRGASPVLAELAASHGKTTGKATVVPEASHTLKQDARTVVLGAAWHGDPDEIPF